MAHVRLNLDGVWDFFPDPQQAMRFNTLGEAGPPRGIRVPGPWQAQFTDLRDMLEYVTPVAGSELRPAATTAT